MAMVTEQGASEDNPNARLIAGMSIVIVREAFGSMPLMFLSAIAAYGALTFCMRAFPLALRMSFLGVVKNLPELNVNFVLFLFLYICQSTVLASVAIAIHRLILRNETLRGTIIPLSRRVLLFTAWLFAQRLPILFIFALSPFVNSAVHAVKTVASFSVLGIALAMIFATVRLSLIFPAIAIDEPSDRFSSRVVVAWRLSRNRFWRLWGSTFLALMAIVAIAIALFIAVWLCLTTVRLLGINPRLSPFATALLSVVASSTIAVFAAALIAASLSWNYRIVTAWPALPDLRVT